MEKIIESFHLLWDSFPTRVRLIQKDRTVIAVNKAAEAAGNKTGVRCIDEGGEHTGCLANLALRDKEAKVAYGSRIRFWVPVDGSDDLFVHFSIPANDPSVK